MNLIDELVRFGKESIRVMGEQHGSAYVDRCIKLWTAEYGDSVAQVVMKKIRPGAPK